MVKAPVLGISREFPSSCDMQAAYNVMFNESTGRLQGSSDRRAPGSVNFVPAVAYNF